MKKIILLTTGIILFSCSSEDVSDDQNLINEIESHDISEQDNSDTSSSTTSKDTDNDGINNEARYSMVPFINVGARLFIN